MLALCRSSPRIYRCCSRRSIFSTALPRPRTPAFARSSINIRTLGSPRSSQRGRAARAWKSCCTTCRAAIRSAASTAPLACRVAKPASATTWKSQCATRARLHATYVSNLKYAARRLADEGMQLPIEPLSERTVAGCFLTSSAQAARTLDEVAAPNAFIQYDLFHMQIMEGNLAATIEQLLPRIGHM
ncbi:MAG TPA: TIM barrel protein, partial [Burkholderiales bacterium]|nr:TIM barrel protein [Burkholderiales bacterium]